jgi:putative transposase
MGRRLLQSEQSVMLLVDVLRVNAKGQKFRVHDFVVLPDHFHAVITINGDMTIEKAMQLIKGGFSFRIKKEMGYAGEVWQRGFSEIRVDDRESFLKHREYIAQNPVKAGLANSPDEFPYCYSYLARQKAAGAKAQGQTAAVRHD